VQNGLTVFLLFVLSSSLFSLCQIVFDEKELRREISHAIKNVHGVRQVEERRVRPVSSHITTTVLCSFLFTVNPLCFLLSWRTDPQHAQQSQSN
jgi:hypothetical protein